MSVLNPLYWTGLNLFSSVGAGCAGVVTVMQRFDSGYSDHDWFTMFFFVRLTAFAAGMAFFLVCNNSRKSRLPWNFQWYSPPSVLCGMASHRNFFTVQRIKGMFPPTWSCRFSCLPPVCVPRPSCSLRFPRRPDVPVCARQARPVRDGRERGYGVHSCMSECRVPVCAYVCSLCYSRRGKDSHSVTSFGHSFLALPSFWQCSIKKRP